MTENKTNAAIMTPVGFWIPHLAERLVISQG